MKKKARNLAFILLGVWAVLAVCFYITNAWAGNKTVTFAWNQDMSEGFAGWKLYKSTTANVSAVPGNLFATIAYSGAPAQEYTTDQVLSSPDGQVVTYYFVMTAFDNQGNESAKSNEVSARIDFQAPGVPVQLKVTVTTP